MMKCEGFFAKEKILQIFFKQHVCYGFSLVSFLEGENKISEITAFFQE